MEVYAFDDQHQYENPQDYIECVIQPDAKNLGGFTVNRCLPMAQRRSVGPWVFFDEMGPAVFEGGAGINVRPHPHINLATVSYLFSGQMWHRDSLGTSQVIHAGDVNLMVAGRGIVHSERPMALDEQPYKFHGLQLWQALPADVEETAPTFFHYPSDRIPVLDAGGVRVKLIIGYAYGVQSPVQMYYRTLYMVADLKPGQSLLLPLEEDRALYVLDGSVWINGKEFGSQKMIVLSPYSQVEVFTKAGSSFAVIGGEAIGRRFLDWNFVSTRRERIDQAKKDWLEGRFPVIPGDDKEFIPLPK